MKTKQPSLLDYNRPVAYDAEGRPLYAHPPENQPRIVHMSRSVEPEQPIISGAIKAKHDKSLELFPGINLSEGEYVVSFVKRHPIGLFTPLALSVLLIAISLTILLNYDLMASKFQIAGIVVSASVIITSIVAFICLVALGAYISYYVYFNNRLFLTNESVIQEIQNSLFAKAEQTVSLLNIEDASFTQNGIIQQIFDFGSIRLSTEGEETTYRFSYVANPKQHIDILNNTIEAFKNGRPVTDNSDN